MVHCRKASVLDQAVYCSVAELGSVANVAELIPRATTRDHKLGGGGGGTDGWRGAGRRDTKCKFSIAAVICLQLSEPVAGRTPV